MSSQRIPDAVQSGSDGSQDRPNKRQRGQVAATQAASHQAPALHILPTAVASPSQGSSLNVQNLYHLQLAQAPLTQPAMLNKSHPGRSLLHLTGHSEQEQQHQQQLNPADQLDQQQDLLNRLDETEPGEASMPSPANTDYKHKPRRKANERPLGTDQIRQAFSKRKRGLALKCYQLHKLTDAKVFCFIMKEKGTSWAYATPGFGASLSATNLRQMRQLTGFDQVSDGSKQITEVMPHPAAGDADDRDAYASPMHPMMAQPSASLVGGPDFDPEPEVVEHGPTREIGVQVTSHIYTGYPDMRDVAPAQGAQPPTDEVRSFVTELAHIAYSRGVPTGPIPTPAAGGDPSLPTPPSSSGHMLQQTLVNLPTSLPPGHPGFDQHAYQLLLQQQQQQQQQHMPAQLQQLSHQSHQHASADGQRDMKEDLQRQQVSQAQESQLATSAGQHDADHDGRSLNNSGHLDHLS